MATLCLPGLEIKKNSFTYYLNINKSENAIKYLIQNPQYILWDALSSNPYAFNLLIENSHKIYWKYFCNNPNPAVIDVLLKNPNKISWESLSENPLAIDILIKNQHKIHWSSLSGNPAAIELLTQNKHRINYDVLSDNPNAFDLIKEYIETHFISINPDPTSMSYKIIEQHKHKYIKCVCFNKNEKLIKYLYTHHINHLCWFNLSTNSAAIDILLENMDKIQYKQLSLNRHPKALEILKRNPTHIYWINLSMHINDYSFIAEQNPVLKEWIWSNPIIFDYKKISKYYMDKIKEELMQKALHPKRIEKWLDQGLDMDDL